MRIALLESSELEAALPDLAAVLVDCVDGGASVGYLAGLTDPRGVGVLALDPHLVDGARLGGVGRRWRRRGCVLLAPESRPNGRHRAEVRKLLVHRRAGAPAWGEAS